MAFKGDIKPKMPLYFRPKYRHFERSVRASRPSAWGRQLRDIVDEPQHEANETPAVTKAADLEEEFPLLQATQTRKPSTARNKQPRKANATDVPADNSVDSLSLSTSLASLPTTSAAESEEVLHPLAVDDLVYAFFYTDWFPARVRALDSTTDEVTVLWESEWSQSRLPRSHVAPRHLSQSSDE